MIWRIFGCFFIWGENWYVCVCVFVSHRKTMKLRRIQRKPRREGTSHWLSSSRIVWTRTARPTGGATEAENERVRPVQEAWVVKQNLIRAENNSGCGWCHLTGLRICLCKRYHKWIRHGQSRPGISFFRCSQSLASIWCLQELTQRDLLQFIKPCEACYGSHCR